MSPARGGQLHLRLFFNYLGNFERLKENISLIDWYGDSCSKISLVYDGDRLLRGQTVVTRSKGSDWETGEAIAEQGYIGWAIGRLQAERADRVASSESA